MIRKGTQVMWKAGKSTQKGKVLDTFTPREKKKDKGKPRAQKKDGKEKVLLIEQAEGRQLIKRESEVSRAKDPSGS
jgi:hypothetical protein